MNYNAGEQNKYMNEARQTRDWKNTLAVLHYLHDRTPLCNDSSLRSIVTGVHAHPTVNVDTAHAVGATILNSMDGRTPDEHTFKRKYQFVTLGTNNSVRIDGDDVPVDPLLLFQRRITVALPRHQTNWSLHSNMNYAATHQLSLIHFSCSEKRTSQPMLMPYGVLLDLTSQQTTINIMMNVTYHLGLYAAEPLHSRCVPRRLDDYALN